MENESINLLREILMWTKVGYFDKVHSLLERTLDSDKKRRAYQASGGSKTQSQIASEVQISTRDIVELFRRCENMGLMTQVGNKRTRLFDLDQFGMLPDSSGKRAKKPN